mmetsp:Transcript_10109/g.15323  ORF Transcript_10109/g.15323 Transcript_10109/m.15323 type:complete len:396 (-) Transcript_10109:106-1293(-)
MKRSRDHGAYLTLVGDSSDISGAVSVPPVIKLSKGRLIIGRGSPNVSVDAVLSIRVDDKEVISRTHAEVVGTIQGDYVIRDLGSTNGVFVNSCRIDSCTLQDGDIVQFGGVAKVPVGKMLKCSAENARYRFSYTRGTPLRSNDTVKANITSSGDGKRSSSGKKVKLSSSVAPSIPEESEAYLLLQQKYLETCSRLEEAEKKASEERRKDSLATCVIDFSALQDMLKCAICHLTLLDAVVMSCSHGFCRACIESHMKKGGSICPICNDRGDKRRGSVYYRSENLDSIVYLLQQASSPAEAKSFKEREKKHFDILRRLGIDPLQPAGFVNDELTQSSRKTSSTKKHKPVVCDYCGEPDHSHENCPHDDATNSLDNSKFGRYGYDGSHSYRSDEESDV